MGKKISKPVPGIMAISSRGAAVPMRFISVLIGIRVLFFHERIMITAMLGTGRQAVPAFPSAFVVVVLI